MDAAGLSANSMNVGAAKLNASVQMSVQRSALDVVETQAAQLIQSIEIPAGLTFTPDGPSAGTQRNFIADM